MTARARRYPQPPPSGQVLRGARCDHGALTGLCPLCRLAGVDDNQDTPAAPEPAAPRRHSRRPPKPPLAPPIQLELADADDLGPASQADQ